VSLYGDATLNGPLVSPIYDGVHSPTPIYPDNGVIGEIEGAIGSGLSTDGVTPPQF